ncbi:Cytosolic beta-glucosidase, partial [Frankliniella fusca]
MQMYRFSLSWSRILPDGDPNNINQAGIDYYNNLINELRANGIEPFITLYHFDHPQVIEDTIGGWTNYAMIEKMEQFGRVAFAAFSDRVKYWVTLNEPHMHCNIVYNTATVPPAKLSPGLGEYQCIYHELIAHSRLYHIFKKEFAAKARPG